MDAVAFIPARLDSSRLPRKPLLYAGDKSIVEHTCRRVQQVSGLRTTVVVSGDDEIITACSSFAPTILSERKFANGTARVADAARRLKEKGLSRVPIRDSTVIVNVQADEVAINPYDIELLLTWMNRERRFSIGTLAAPLAAAGMSNPNVVKVWTDGKPPSTATEFSRNASLFTSPLSHVGVYALRYDALQDLAESGALDASNHEDLEQVGWMRHYSILVVDIPSRPLSINSPADFAAFSTHVASNARRSYSPTRRPTRRA